MLSKHLKVALTILSLSLVATASTPRHLVRRGDPESYCPSFGDITDDERLSLFNAFTQMLFDAANNKDADEVGLAFSKYVSPELIEHTASASSYGADVGFLSTLLPGTTVTPIGGLSGCFNSTNGDPICTIHYAARPDGSSSLIPNVTAISDFYRYDGSCIVEHWDSTYIASATTTNPNFPGSP
ncbi:uncharacterized protein PV09_06059 [Verruconis gallopava]|uniref:SnoaL-like domain-containing protein n=1 Tax=Verruconis gallopava TaxID=253628 RepID=A0A0D1XJY3_9PEZI|nr:uncharacterized protein PV09_06059 [Verruconis gallopava]KIW02611.1 hypothetical protein PV09_06059 [Verruconis gallopava]